MGDSHGATENARHENAFTRTQLAAKSGALSCRLMHSCSAMDRHIGLQHAVLHTIAFLAFSCPAIHVSHFQRPHSHLPVVSRCRGSEAKGGRSGV